jgi:pimeloyl-ACP methyl ester carboxylesterase
LMTIDTSFGKILPSLAKTQQVIAIEQQAHGHTADIDRPLTHKQMAEDTVELLRQLKIEKADFFGYSMGGEIALQIAIRHPDLVRKLVVASVTFNSGGYHPGVLAGIASMTPEALTGFPFEEAYAMTAPNPEDWPTLIAKVKQLYGQVQDWLPEDIQTIKAPTLVMIGSRGVQAARRRRARRSHRPSAFPARGAARHHPRYDRGTRRLAAIDGYRVSRRAHTRGWVTGA